MSRSSNLIDNDGCRVGGPSCSACAFARISEAVLRSSAALSWWMSLQYLLRGCACVRHRRRLP